MFSRMSDDEVWVKVPRTGDYEVSSKGGLRRIMAGTPSANGYHAYHVRRTGQKTHILAHRLVWESFHGPIPKGMSINHKNGVKTDNRLDNLEMITQLQNVRHAIATGLWDPGLSSTRRKASGVTHGAKTKPHAFGRRGEKRDKLTAADIPVIRGRIANESCAKIARDYGVSISTISNVMRGKTWKEVA